MGELPTGTVTFLFTDIEKSTRLLATDASVMRAALVAHHDLMRAAIERNDGVVFETIGDAVYAVFARPSNALAAAIASQRGLRAHSDVAAGVITARMAIHSGEIERRDAQHYVGEPLFRAARLLVLGSGGQTLVSGATEALAKSTLPRGATLRDLGEHRLKDLPGREHVFQLDHPDLTGLFPPLRSLDARPNNLPSQLTSFVGRARELAELAELMETARLLTLTGVGGAGKTRLAIEFASRSLDANPDGCWLIELAPIIDPELVWSTVGGVLGVREQPGESLRASITDYLRGRRVLLVFDNCEHLLDACAAAVGELLRACRLLRVVATSRQPLGLEGERVWRTPSLREAVDLFVERARGAGGSVDLVAQHSAIERLCDRLDRLPLAIELAAPRTRALSLDEITQRLDDRLRLLTGGSRTVVARHQTLRAAIDWSFSLLDEPERVMWQRLSVFAGGATLDAAEAVCAGGIVPAPGVLDLVTSLVDKSLIVPELTEPRGVRYRMLDSLHEYASERLALSGDAESVPRAYAEYFLALAERGRQHIFGGPEQGDWLDRLEDEIDNVRATMRWAVDHAPHLAVRLAVACSRFLTVRAHLSDAVGWRDAILPHVSEVDAGLGAEVLLLAGTIHAFREEYERAIGYHSRALESFIVLNDEKGMADALRGLGGNAARMGDDLASRDYFTQSLELDRRTESKHGIATSYSGLGRVAWRQGDYRGARPYYEEAARLRSELGDRLGVAWVQQEFAYVLNELGEMAEAERIAKESAAIFRQMGARRALIGITNTLAALAADRGDHNRALSLYEESEVIARELDIGPSIAMTFIARAEVTLSIGELDRAAALAYKALELLGAIPSNRGITWCWDIAGRVAHLRGHDERAAQLLGATATARQRIGLVPPPKARTQFEATVARLHRSLGEDRFTRAWAEGAALSREETTARSLAALSGTPIGP